MKKTTHRRPRKVDQVREQGHREQPSSSEKRSMLLRPDIGMGNASPGAGRKSQANGEK